MTEQEWLECTDPQRMLDFVSFRCKPNARANERSERKLRLLAVACCHGAWQWMPDQRSRRAVETAGKQADGLVSEQELQAARNEAGEANDSLVGKAAHLSESARAAWYTLLHPEFLWVADVVRSAVRFSVSANADGYRISPVMDPGDVKAATLRENARQLGLLRDIFGNPFHPARIDPVWLTWRDTAIPKLAQTIYEDRLLPSGHLDPSRLAVLADMLEEAGCTDAELLGYLRSEGPHVRGCWVLDLLTGRK